MPTEMMPARNLLSARIAPAPIRRQQSDGLVLVTIEARPVTELHLTLTPMRDESITALAGRLAGVLQSRNATVVRQTVFGPTAAAPATLKALRQALNDPDLLVTWVEGTPCASEVIAGMQIHAVTGPQVRTVRDHGALLRIWDDARAKHCVVNSILPDQVSAASPEQAREVLEKLRGCLAVAGMTMKEITRTWFYLDDLLAWYGDFNRVRDDVFARQELRPHRLPASTGVSGRNPAGAALTAAAWAIRPHDPAVTLVHSVPSPEQCPAPAYGSAFSRAVEIRSAGFRQLLVSGTASIAPDGKTEHTGDVRAQIERTMQVAAAILKSQRMTYADVSLATAFFKSPGDAPLFADWQERHDQLDLPIVRTVCGICRSDLLFEIELSAVRAK
ncbi:MAG TPA: hypothetical protein VMB80_18335 [Candidatus Acidoferrum sp.]|nr:hypothetical protein [Candidatus Acidoferrum sp.]